MRPRALPPLGIEHPTRHRLLRRKFGVVGFTRPREVAEAVRFALSRPAGSEVREMVVCASTDTSWP